MTITEVAVSEGYFSVPLDFGDAAFNGDARWLAIAVRCPTETGDYASLTPRQALTAAPYALQAMHVPWEGVRDVPAGFADGVDDVRIVISDTQTLSVGEGLSQVTSEESISISLAIPYRLPQTCADGQVAEWYEGVWVCGDDDGGGGGGTGDITAVHAGTGLSGGGGSGAVTLTLSLPVSTATQAQEAVNADTVDGEHASAFADAVHTHAGSDITSAVPTATLALSATQAQEAVNADTVDGEHASAFADAGHTHAGSDITSAVPTATLALSATQVPWAGLTGVPADIADGDDNIPPVAVLQAAPPTLYLGESNTGTVALSLTLSYDPEGGALSYAFDPTGQTTGVPAAYGDVSTETAVYARAGDYLAAGWVQDSPGAFNRAQALVSVYRFGSTTVDKEDGSVGWYTSLAVVEGHPAIAYYGNLDLRYVWAEDATGVTWGSPLTVDSVGNVGKFASLMVVDGHPAITYYDDTNNNLMYVRANDATGATWGITYTVDSGGIGGNVGRYASSAIIEGHPAIAYRDDTNNALNYVRAGNKTGTSWDTPRTVDNAGTVGLYTSLAMVNGRPAIAYYEFSSGDLRYARADDVTGSSWSITRTVDSVDDVGDYASLAVVDGHPAIAYYDDTNDDLKYVRAEDADGTTWGSPLVVDSVDDVGMYASLIVVNGRPAIAYNDNSSGHLRYVESKDATGSIWDSPFIVDNASWVGRYISIALVEGRPAMAYYDLHNTDLHFTIPRQD